MTRFLKSWLAGFLWMGVIFAASTDIGSAKQSSRIIIPLLKWLNPAVSKETIELVQLVVRKSGHLTVYAVLAMLLWRGLRNYKGDFGSWRWSEAAWIILVAAFYACTDEFHQSFVSSRYGSPLDVAIDAAGAALGLLLIWIFLWIKKSRGSSPPSPERL
jgi:VanZ family protein